MGIQIEEGYKMITAPSGPSGENIPGTGTQQESGLYGPTEYSGGGGAEAKDLKTGARLLVQKGFPAKGAAFLAGNIQQESGWNAKRKPWVLGDGAGVNYTGSGGGGAGQSDSGSRGGAGGKGIVIVRYLTT